MSVLQHRRVVLGVTGGISAYKAAELTRLLKKAGAEVHVVMTRAACRFITPLTLQTLSGHPVARDLFDLGQEAQIGHIRLADEADAVVVAPATADSVARFAAGMADDLLSAVLLATRAPVLLAPAMNVNMWENPLTRDNLARLVRTGRVTTVGPDAGELACGWIGAGRLIEPTEIVTALERLVAPSTRPLFARRVVVTAGPTFEPIDDVRFLGNRSSGKMGFAVAAVAAQLGAEVTLVAGPVALPTPVGVARRIDVESALEMQRALRPAATGADVVVMVAAVSDFRPAARAAGKLSRRAEGAASVVLAANPDLLAELSRGRQGTRPVLVGFAAEAGGDLVERARAKLEDKGCDVIAANDVAAPGLGFGSDRNALILVFRDGRVVPLPAGPKEALARSLWAEILPLVEAPANGGAAAMAGTGGAP
jgi:phosphopantothenoylcysteine decarboxylase / phosphopantothenate---cysteine ligase